MAERLRLTNRELKKRTESGTVKDSEINGLETVIGVKTKTFYLVKKINGSVRRIKLGKFPSITVEQARAVALRLIAQTTEGRDPYQDEKDQEKKELSRNAITLEIAFNAFIEARKIKPGTKSLYKILINKHLADWKDKPLSSIAPRMVTDRYKALSSSPATATNTFRTLRAVFNFAQQEYEDQDHNSLFPVNPCKKLSHNQLWEIPERRQSRLTEKELPIFWKALDEMSGNGGMDRTIRDYIALSLLTGLRKNEAMSLSWENVNFEERWFGILDTKNGNPLYLPMTEYLFNLLSERHKLTGGKGWVFPGSKKGDRIHDVRAALTRIKDKTGVDTMPHDWRRTFATVAELQGGLDRFMIKRLLNHTFEKKDVTSGYIVTEVEALRVPLERVGKAILGLCGVKSQATIDRLPRARAIG